MSTTTATLFGFLYAYAVTRTNVPLKRVFRFISILPLFSPPFMVAFSYMMMFGKNGLVSHQLLGLNMNIFGWHGLWLCQTIAFFPAACLVMEGVLQIHRPQPGIRRPQPGSTGFKLFRTITLPLADPGNAPARRCSPPSRCWPTSATRS